MRIRRAGFVAGLCGLALAVLVIAWWTRSTAPVRVSLVESPGRDEVPGAAGDRATLISGRRVSPAGRVVRTQSYSWGMAVAPDQSRVALIRSDAIEQCLLYLQNGNFRICLLANFGQVPLGKRRFVHSPTGPAIYGPHP